MFRVDTPRGPLSAGYVDLPGMSTAVTTAHTSDLAITFSAEWATVTAGIAAWSVALGRPNRGLRVLALADRPFHADVAKLAANPYRAATLLDA